MPTKASFQPGILRLAKLPDCGRGLLFTGSSENSISLMLATLFTNTQIMQGIPVHTYFTKAKVLIYVSWYSAKHYPKNLNHLIFR